jgi:hypothetical protein
MDLGDVFRYAATRIIYRQKGNTDEIHLARPCGNFNRRSFLHLRYATCTALGLKGNHSLRAGLSIFDSASVTRCLTTAANKSARSYAGI